MEGQGLWSSSQLYSPCCHWPRSSRGRSASHSHVGRGLGATQQMSATMDPQTKSSQSPVFVNEVLLWHSYTHLAAYHLWLLSRWESWTTATQTMWSTKPKYLLSGLLQKKETFDLMQGKAETCIGKSVLKSYHVLVHWRNTQGSRVSEITTGNRATSLLLWKLTVVSGFIVMVPVQFFFFLPFVRGHRQVL